MIRIGVEAGFANIVESVEELPNPHSHRLKFVDVETTSSEDREALYPYRGDRFCGVAVSFGDSREAFYLPVRHKQKRGNLPLDSVKRWLKDLLSSGELTNHNLKFDLHFFSIEDILFGKECILNDTLQQAKLIDSDRLDHSLKGLSRDWLGFSAEDEKIIEAYLTSIKSKDYARVPIDILGQYACSDVLMNKDLYAFLLSHKHSELNWVWANEQKLTATLWQMERHGLKVDKKKTLVKQMETLRTLIEHGESIEKETGTTFTGSNQNLQEIVLHQLGLPVLVWNDPSKKTGKVSPNFGFKTMIKYLVLPEVVMDRKKYEMIKNISAYLSAQTQLGLYWKAWPELWDDNGFVHTSVNPNVRTGRPSASGPNLFQLNHSAKEAIIPDSEDDSFFQGDASQIEFRWIVKTIRQPELIKVFQDNPRTDFHTLIGEKTGGGRDFGKTCNFMIGFGAGERKTISEVASNAKVMKSIMDQVEQLVRDGVIQPENKLAVFSELAIARATSLYSEYHELLYNLRKYSKIAENVCKKNGFVRNEFGRRRHLFRDPITDDLRYWEKNGKIFTFAHKAFNTYNQSSAIDFIKGKLNLLSDFYNADLASYGITLRLWIYDSVILHGATEVVKDPKVQKIVMDILNQRPPKSPIEFPWDCGTSNVNLAKAK